MYNPKPVSGFLENEVVTTAEVTQYIRQSQASSPRGHQDICSRCLDCVCCISSRSPHGINDDFREISAFFMGITRYQRIFQELETSFIRFLQRYYPLQFQNLLRPPEFKKWYFNRKKGLPHTLPIPTPEDYETARDCTRDGRVDDVLLLFFWQQLVELGVLRHSRQVDEQILYCRGLAKKQEIEQQMLEGKLFVEDGPTMTLAHGRYSHLLQLVLIAIARRRRVLDLSVLRPENLVSELITQRITNDRRPKLAWDFCLDDQMEKTIFGPAGLTVLMLSQIGARWCPRLHSYLGYNYIERLKEQADYDHRWGVQIHIGKEKERSINLIIKDIVQVGTVASDWPPKLVWLRGAEKIGENLYQKRERTHDFRVRAARIMTDMVRPARSDCCSCFGHRGSGSPAPVESQPTARSPLLQES